MKRRFAFGVAGLWLASVVSPWAAQGQTPPAGNAHPESHLLSETDRALGNPFGEPVTDPKAVATPDAKAAFAAKVDIEPLRGLAVFHNGRVKILDTLARETVREITGRRDYLDYLRVSGPAGEKVEAHGYDPVFTLLDMTIDPVYYLDKPLIAVNYLPLREAILERAYPGDEGARKRWLRVGRVTPAMIDAHAGEVLRSRMNAPDAEQLRRGAGEIDYAVRLFLESRQNYLLVAPPATDLAWVHLSALAPEAPARRAAMALGDAWRQRNTEAVNDAIRTLAAELPRVNAGVYPGGRRSLELRYNRANAFEWGYWAYFASLVTLLLAFGTGRRWLAGAGVTLLAGAVLLHGAGFVARCIIAERFAIQNQFESMTGVSLFAAVVGAGIMVWRRQLLFGAAAAAVGFMVLITATQAAIPGGTIQREAAILNTSVLLKYHVTTVLCSYGLIALGMVVSLFYLGVHYSGRGTRDSERLATTALGAGGATRDQTLADLDKAQMVVLQLAFWTLGVGILLGAWWADHSWGRFWGFDPKETWALITWIVYLVVIHVRFATGNRGLVTAWLSVLGFLVMLWTYFGVNLLLPGLHAYA